MRTIKFRGKDSLSNTWEYGDLVQHTLADGTQKASIVKTYETYDVMPETVGQFTGLIDKNGKEIYEGDIVECVSWNEYFTNSDTGEVMQPFRRIMYVDFRNGGFKMVEKMSPQMKDNEWDIIYNGDIVVIGNIYEK